MIGIHKTTYYHLLSQRICHIRGHSFLEIAIELCLVMLLECVNVDIRVLWVKYQGSILVLLEVRSYMEDLGKVPFSRKLQLRRHHADFTTYIYSVELHNPPKNTNQLLVVRSISSIHFSRAIQFRSISMG